MIIIIFIFLPSVTWIAGGHYVPCVKDLLREFGDGHSLVLLRTTAAQRGVAREKEVQSREGDHVNGQLSEVSV